MKRENLGAIIAQLICLDLRTAFITMRDHSRNQSVSEQVTAGAYPKEAQMARVMGLGHVGIYVRDLERMVAFYRDVMGMQITKQNWRAGAVFLSADPEAVDHEIALMRGRPEGDKPHLINQISMRVASLDEDRKSTRLNSSHVAISYAV